MSKNTGLGTDTFFNSNEANQVVESAVVEPVAPAKPKPAKAPKKVRTTVTLYPRTLAAMELLKAESRKEGERSTLSDILGDAIDLLLKKKKISVE